MADITVGNYGSLQLETAGTIDDGAVLSLVGSKSVNGNKIVFSSGFTETVDQLWLDNGSGLTQLPAGDYTAASSPAGSPASGGAVLGSDGQPIISGSGILTVLTGGGGDTDPLRGLDWRGRCFRSRR